MQPHCAHLDGCWMEIKLQFLQSLNFQRRKICVFVCLDLLLLHALTTELIFAEMWR